MTARKPSSGTTAVISFLIGPGIPAGYMAITGTTPTWARVWYLALMVLALLMLVAKASRSDG